MELLNSLYKLCDTLSEELEKVNQKLDQTNGELSGDDMGYIEKLTHSLKSVKTTIAMIEAEGEYSQRGSYDDGSYRRSGNNYGRGGSYANNRRDSRGRYMSRNGGYSGGYSYHGNDMVEELEQLMQETPNENIKQEFSKLINKVQQMQ